MEPANHQQPRNKMTPSPRFRAAGIVTGLLLLVFLPAGVLWHKANNNENAAVETKTSDTAALPAAEEMDTTLLDQEGPRCPELMRNFRDDILGLQFCYPTAWGDVIVSDTRFDLSEPGSRFKLEFTDKSAVSIGLVSDDWATEVARDSGCSDLAVQTFPETSGFSHTWVAEGSDSAVVSATRGLELDEGEYMLQEHVDELLTNGVCIEGYRVLGSKKYDHAAVSYYAPFAGTVDTPQAHIDDPTELVPSDDRVDFTAVVKSIKKL